jgi:hypothetical protein
MPIVFLAHNGIGVGHLARTLTFCDELTRLGESPIVFGQGPTKLGNRWYPGKRIPNIIKCSPKEKANIARELRRYAEISHPAVVFEDTHPSELDLGKAVRRILVVRPTDFSYLVELQNRFKKVYHAFLIADSPGSPTWPYSTEHTSRILSWPNWFMLGPVYRVSTEPERQDVRQRYGIDSGDSVCVFSMGGAGVHFTGDSDVTDFLDIAVRVGTELRQVISETRLLFVRGPFFPDAVSIPDLFEVVRDEPCVPALMAVARGAVVRPGFNTTWECVAGGTPFLPVQGGSFLEPIDRRLVNLRELGYMSADLSELWSDPDWLASKARRAEWVTKNWPGSPDAAILRQQLRSDTDPLPTLRRRWADIFRGWSGNGSLPRRASRNNPAAKPKLAIRIDDVVGLDDKHVSWLLELLLDLKLHASLEVIPYLCRFTEADLNALDPSRQFTVGQHGYAHVPRVSTVGWRCEFGINAVPGAEEIEQIRLGREILLQRFPERFRGGYSPPYDGLADWLGPAWQEMGGEFVSCIAAQPAAGRTPIARTAIETWDWAKHAPVGSRAILDQFDRSSVEEGKAGIVIHAGMLNISGERERITKVLRSFQARGVENIPISDLLGPLAPEPAEIG